MLRYLLLPFLLCGTLSAQPFLPDRGPQRSETARTIFTVFTPQTRAEQSVWRLQSAGQPQTELTTHRLRDHTDSTQIMLPPAKVTSLNTYLERQSTTDTLVLAPGAVSIDEVLDYPGSLSPEQRQLVESYLAIRHGLTLDQRIPRHYLSPGDDAPRIVWDANEGRDFRYRIAGLAVDASARIDHRSGSSAYAPGQVSMQWPEDVEIAGYVLWGDDNLPTARAEITGNLTRLSRTWRVQATGSLPPTALRIKPERFFARPVPGERWVLLREGFPPLAAQEAGDGTMVWPEVRWAEGASQFQLGLECVACTPTPISTQENFFTLTQVSPNPAPVGAAVDVRIALAKSTPLFLTLIDATGRKILSQRLPASTHHLAQLRLPAAGVYALHLYAVGAHSTSLKLFAQ